MTRRIVRAPTHEEVRKARRALEMKRDGYSFTDIAKELGYSDRAGAHKAYQRALAWAVQEPADQVVKLHEARLEELWRIAFARAAAGDMDGVHAGLRVMERHARLRGLDHADGLAERSLALEAERIKLVALSFGAALDVLADHVELTADLRALVTRTMVEHMRAHTDDAGNVVDETGEPVLTLPPVDNPPPSGAH